MNNLQAENISKSFGDLVLFENLSISIDHEDKIALIARNGAGKTTLLDILSGKEKPDSGKVTLRNNVTISYLEQDPVMNNEITVIEQVFASSSEIIAAIREYEHAIVNYDKSKLDIAIRKMDSLNAWDYEARIKQILSKLKISNFDQKIGELSGGQKKRIALANAIINKSDILILDEPTNHLDMEMVEWLESWLTNIKCSVIMVTHDRYFLNRICHRILELDEKKIYEYQGNYSYFIEKREERINNTNANLERARSILKKELEWMRRMPSARGTKAKSRVDSFYELQEFASGKIKENKVEIDIKPVRLGKKIIEVHYLNKRFDDLVILKDLTYNFTRGEKLGIIGNNGTGKTTFLNIITGLEKADSGKTETGETVVFGYYRQEGLQFDENKKVIDIVRDIADVVTLSDGKSISVSRFLSYFLFPPDLQNNYVSKLSGGERRRLYLTTIFMNNPNFLILDEPTNDLDILTLNVLEEFLQNYNGCLIVVSHDRYFLDKVANHLFVFEGNGIIRDFPGDYSDYRAYEQKRGLRKKKNDPLTREKYEDDRQINKNRKKFTFKHKHEYENIIKEIDTLESEKAILERKLNGGGMKQDELNTTSSRLGEIIEMLEEKENRWLELSELMEEDN